MYRQKQKQKQKHNSTYDPKTKIFLPFFAFVYLDSMSLLEQLQDWPTFAQSIPLSPRAFFALGGLLAHWIPFWGFNAILYFFYKYDLFPQWRIQGLFIDIHGCN